jgi:hypothetical protein
MKATAASSTSSFNINPLMPELNLSEQHCLPEFFTGPFKF